MDRIIHYLPGGMEFKDNPNEIPPPKPATDTSGRRKRTDWNWAAKALAAKPGKWAVIARNQPTKELARNINRGAIAAFNPELYEADAAPVEGGRWDVYAKLRGRRVDRAGLTDTEAEQLEDNSARERMKMRREWFDKWQREWSSFAQDNYPEEYEAALEAEREQKKKELYS